MIRDIKNLFGVLNKRQKNYFIKVQLLSSLQAITEVVSVLLLIPFMSVVGNISLIKENLFFKNLFNFFNFENEFQFIVFFSIFIILFFAFSSWISVFSLKKITYLGVSLGMDLSKNLYEYYMRQDWLFHTRNNTSSILNKISIESNRITSSIILPLILTISKVFLIVFMYITLVILNPKFTIFGTIIFFICYYIVFKYAEKKLEKHGKNLSLQQENRFKSINEGLGGIKHILLSNSQVKYLNLFNNASDNYSKSYTNIQVLTSSPRYLLELVAIVAIMLIIIFTIVIDKKNSLELLPILSVFGLAGYKMLPAFQNVYFLLASVKGNFAAFNNIEEDLLNSLLMNSRSKVQNDNKIEFKKEIVFDDIHFDYNNERNTTISGISLKILKNKKIGIVGPSGAGKSTLVDIFLGLLSPTSGDLFIDSNKLNKKNLKSWQANVSYVPQDIFLINNSIKNNIVFGNSDENIDEEKLNLSILQAELNLFIKDLPNGIETIVGERGVQLSGGQKQRIAIARALYQDRPVLVLDEATSSLDTVTEKEIMKNVNKSFREKTILIIAHRLSTIRDCDYIYFIEKGKLVDTGTYEQLLERNIEFKKMASEKQQI